MQQAFNNYLADLAVMNFKLHNLHWNVEGTQFVPVHEFTEALYEECFAAFDDVAEHLKKYGYVPDSTLKAYLANSSIEEIEPRKFDCREALEIVLKDMESLRKRATDLRHACDEQGWFSAVGLFEDQVDKYNKHIWFIKATLG